LKQKNVGRRPNADAGEILRSAQDDSTPSTIPSSLAPSLSSLNPHPPSLAPGPWLLRRTDQSVVAVLVLSALAAMGGWWIANGGWRNGLVEADRTQQRVARYQVDINSAAIPVLKAVLGLPTEVARSIVTGREEKGFLNQQDLVLRVPELAPFIAEAGKLIVYQSATPYYTIESKGKGKEGGSVQGIKVVVKIDPSDKNGYKIVQWVDRLL